MDTNPYAPPTAALPSRLRMSQLARASVAPAVLGFLAVPAFVVGVSLATSAPLPSFLRAPGFLATLAACGLAGGAAGAAARPIGWLRFVIAVAATIALLAAVVLVLVAMTR